MTVRWHGQFSLDRWGKKNKWDRQEGALVQHFDNTKYDADVGKGSWDGVKWVAAAGGPVSHQLVILTKGAWRTGFRPQSMITDGAFPAGSSLFGFDTADNPIYVNDEGQDPGVEYEFDPFFGLDIKKFAFLFASASTITNIRFRV